MKRLALKGIALKRTVALWLLAVLLLVPSVCALAEPEDENLTIKTVSGYCLGDELYTFLKLNENYDSESFRAVLKSEQVAAGDGELAAITDSSAIVRYVFMVDLSGSMSRYKQEVNSFVTALMEKERQEAFYTVATFGTGFSVVQQDMTDKNTVTAVLDALDYRQSLTDPYTGVMGALTYLDGYSIRSGDLIHLVVITDGDPDLGIADAVEAETKESELAAAAAKKIEETPEVVVSSLCVGEWDEPARTTFTSGRGVHAQVAGTQGAASAGEALAADVDSLYRVRFLLNKSASTERFAMTLELRGKDRDGRLAQLVVDMENVPNLKMFSNDSWDTSPGGEGRPEVIGGTDKADEKEDGESEPPRATDDGETVVSTEDSTEPEELTDSKSKFLPERPILVILLFGILCVLVVAVICMIVLMRKKKPSPPAQPMPQMSPMSQMSPMPQTAQPLGGLMMRLEVYAGRCQNYTPTLSLNGFLIVGSAPDCGLMFGEPDVAPQHCRIFMRDSMVYIEDLHSPQGTLIGGMRIQGQNRLRSGDIITIGSAEFCLKF